jgi:hypothetical protein
MNIYEKIIKVMESVEYLKKDDTVGSGKSQYKAISDEKVKVSIRNQMIANKLVMFRVSVDTETISREYEQYNDYKKINENKIQHFCKVKSTYKIVNAENPEESIEIQSIGHGVDPQDKAAGKAMTYASKYAMLDTFIIPTGEDSDKTHSNDIEQPVNKTPQKKVETPQKKEDFKTKLGNLMIEMYKKEELADKLEELTTFEGKDGTVKGKRELKLLSEKQAQATYGKLKKIKEEVK